MPNGPTGEKYTGDLATDKIHWRFAKILTEKTFRKVGVNLGETGPIKLVADKLKTLLNGTIPAELLGDAVGVIAAALLQSPRIVADTLATFTGIDADKLHEMLNEGVDSGIGGLAGAMQHAGGPNEGHLLVAASEAVSKLETGEKFAFIEKVLVVIFGGVIHDDECTEVLDREPQQRRKRTGNQVQADDDDRPRLRPGARKVKLSKACDMGYSTIALPKCCGKAVEKLIAKELLKPSDLSSCVQAFAKAFENVQGRNAQELTQKFYRYMKAANDAQSAEIRDLGCRVVWTPGEIADYLEQSTDIAGFLKHLKRKERPTEKSYVKKAVDAIEAVFAGKSDSAEAAKLRENALKLQQQFARNAGHARHSIDALDAILRKR